MNCLLIASYISEPIYSASGSHLYYAPSAARIVRSLTALTLYDHTNTHTYCYTDNGVIHAGTELRGSRQELYFLFILNLYIYIRLFVYYADLACDDRIELLFIASEIFLN